MARVFAGQLTLPVMAGKLVEPYAVVVPKLEKNPPRVL